VGYYSLIGCQDFDDGCGPVYDYVQFFLFRPECYTCIILQVGLYLKAVHLGVNPASPGIVHVLQNRRLVLESLAAFQVIQVLILVI
jgi:hypothetical protein